MSKDPSLKQQNAWLIRAALLVHALGFAYVAFAPFITARLGDTGSLAQLQAALAPGSISLGIIAIARLVLLGLIPPGLRDRLVHWRWRHPLPGARAFSKIGPADPRVDMTALSKRCGGFPSEPEEQNRLYYSLYRSCSESVGVLDAHKSYLAARDICTINLLLCVLLPPLAYWATQDLPRTATYAAALFVSYLLFAIASQVYATRFVQNVLAVAAPSSRFLDP